MEASLNVLLQALDLDSQIFQAISSLSFQPLLRCAMPCPKPVFSDACLASSDKLHSSLQLLEWFQSLSVGFQLISLFALQFFLFTLGFMYVQRFSYVLRIQRNVSAHFQHQKIHLYSEIKVVSLGVFQISRQRINF